MRPSFPSRTLDVGLQNMWMEKWFQGFKFRGSGGNRYWEGELQPREASPHYLVRVKYNGKRAPNVHVLRPTLVPNAKHTYRDGSVCLFYPPDRSWTPRSIIAGTIIPWTSVWLYCYEFWLDDPSCWYNEEAPHPVKR